VLVTLVAVAVVWVVVAGHFWHHLGRITVAPTRSGERVEVDVSSPAHRAGLADLTAVAETSQERTLRIESDVAVPARGSGHATFDFSGLLRAGEHVRTVKVKK
jgi:hypothetical protein